MAVSYRSAGGRCIRASSRPWKRSPETAPRACKTPVSSCWPTGALGQTLLWRGELIPARAHMAQGMSLYDPQQHHALAFLYGRDPGVDCQDYAAWTLWCLGYSDQALAISQEALSITQELTHPHSLAFAVNTAALLHLFHGLAACGGTRGGNR
jgi:hypothetical protein